MNHIPAYHQFVQSCHTVDLPAVNPSYTNGYDVIGTADGQSLVERQEESGLGADPQYQVSYVDTTEVDICEKLPSVKLYTSPTGSFDQA
jgi:hypothetical protein